VLSILAATTVMGDDDDVEEYLTPQERQKQMILELRKHGKDALDASKWLLSQPAVTKFVGREFP